MSSLDLLTDLCLRCGYDLRGVDNATPCPECGLLAERSRRPSEHLSDATPGWLLGIGTGVTLALLGVSLGVAWCFAQSPVERAVMRTPEYTDYLRKGLNTPLITPPPPMVFGRPLNFEYIRFGVFEIATVVLLIGVLLLTRPERRRESIDDGLLRWSLRMAALSPFAAINLLLWPIVTKRYFGNPNSDLVLYLFIGLLTVGSAPLPALFFTHLRRLAKRVLNIGLAEHAAIVGAGLSVTLVYIGAAIGVSIAMPNSEVPDWVTTITVLIGGVGLMLFGGWSVVNCIRFAMAFFRAYRAARRKWHDADRAR